MFAYRMWLKVRRLCIVGLIGIIAFSYIAKYLF